MTKSQLSIEPATPADQPEIETLLDQAFGLDRQTKTSYRLREGETAIDGLSFVARDATGKIAGTISFWDIFLGADGTKAILLGPLAVTPDQQNSGIGLTLMKHGIAQAKRFGHGIVVLVGDEPYYSKLGFAIVPDARLIMPGPQDPNRLLYLELVPGSLGQAHGLIYSPSRFAAR